MSGWPTQSSMPKPTALRPALSGASRDRGSGLVGLVSGAMGMGSPGNEVCRSVSVAELAESSSHPTSPGSNPPLFGAGGCSGASPVACRIDGVDLLGLQEALRIGPID